MMNTAPRHRIPADAGFTLVEAAIVLVIIGLAVGFVMQGRSLIANAEYRALESRLGDHRHAFHAFRDRYDALPGDMPLEAVETRLSAMVGGGGDGNGIIDHGPGCSEAGAETCLAWRHLRAADLLTGDPAVAGPAARPDHPYAGVVSAWFTGTEGNGVFGHKLLVTGVPARIAWRLDSNADDGRHDRGRISCPDCGEHGYPKGEAPVDIVYGL